METIAGTDMDIKSGMIGFVPIGFSWFLSLCDIKLLLIFFGSPIPLTGLPHEKKLQTSCLCSETGKSIAFSSCFIVAQAEGSVNIKNGKVPACRSQAHCILYGRK